MSTQAAAKIRANLKAAGYNRTRVGVRADNYSMGSSVYVTVKDPTADFAAIEEIANQERSISRCEFSGEILSGGNTYIHVDYSREAEDAMGAPFVEPCRKAFEACSKDVHGDVEGTDCTVSTSGQGHVEVWFRGSYRGTGWTDGEDFTHLAKKVARVIKSADEKEA